MALLPLLFLQYKVLLYQAPMTSFNLVSSSWVLSPNKVIWEVQQVNLTLTQYPV